MKRVYWLVILIVCVAILCACNTDKEGSQKLADPTGVWVLEDTEYYIIDKTTVSRISREDLLQLYASSMEQVLVEEGREAFWELTASDIPLEGCTQKVADVSGTDKILLDKGEITLTEHTVVFYKGETKCSFKRVSKDAQLAGEWIQTLFDEVQQGMMVQTEKVLPTVEEYAEFLRQQEPDIGTWVEVQRDDGARMVSDTGNAARHNGALTITDTSAIYSKGFTRTGTGAFSVEYDGTQFTARHGHYGDLQEVAAFAAPILEAIPYNINVEQLLAIYKQQRTNENGYFLFQYSEDGVCYSITRNNSGKTTELTIQIPSELKVAAAPVERTEEPYNSGFNTMEMVGLSHEKVYNYSFKFQYDFQVDTYMLFDQTGKFYMLANFGNGHELFSDKAIGAYEVAGNQITIYFDSLSMFDEDVTNLATMTAVFEYDPQTKSLNQISESGISWSHKPGHKVTLKETQYYSAKALRSFYN